MSIFPCNKNTIFTGGSSKQVMAKSSVGDIITVKIDRLENTVEWEME